MRRKTLFSAVLLSCLFPGTLPASPLQDGMNAFSVGDYEKAEKILRPIEKEQPSAAYLLRMIDVLNKDAKVRKNSKDIFLRELYKGDGAMLDRLGMVARGSGKVSGISGAVGLNDLILNAREGDPAAVFRMREKFVKKGFVEAVIALPSNLYSNTGIACSLLVLSRNNKNIRMIDATEMVSVGRRQNVLSDENISKILELLNTDDDNSKLVLGEEVAKNEYTLNPSRYLQKEMLIKNGVPFESVIKNITRGAQIKASVLDEIVSDEPTNMQYLMLANLQDGIISDDLPYLKEMNPKYEKYCIKNGSLVISKNVSPVKMAIASVKEGNKILANGNLYVIELDEDKINPYFLKAYLESENGKAALSRVAVGATLLNLPVEGLKKITIPLPDLKSQKIIADKYYAKINEIKELKYKLEKATAELEHIYTEEK